MKPKMKFVPHLAVLLMSILCLFAQPTSAQITRKVNSDSSWWLWWYLYSNDCVSYRKTSDTSVCAPARVTVSLADIKFKKGTSNYSVYWSQTPFTSTPTGASMGMSYIVSVTASTTVYYLITNNNCTEKGSIKIFATIPSGNGKATISGLSSSYCASSLKIKLTGTPSGGIFYGPGIVYGGNDNWYFDPTVPPPGKVKITYSAGGCMLPAEQEVTINPGPCTSVLVGGGSGAVGLIDSPQGITTTCDGKIYFSDSNNNKVWVIDENGARPVIDTAGSKGNTIGSNALTSKLNTPTGLTSYNGIVYFCDQVNHNIKSYNPATNTVAIIAGDNAAVPAAGDLDGVGTAARFKNPYGIAIDALGKTLYVSDATTYKIKKIDIATKTVTTIAGSVQGDVPTGTAVVPALSAQFFIPGHLAIYGNYLYIVDGRKGAIKMLNLSTNMVSIAYSTTGQLSGIDVDCDGNIFYSDLSSNKIFKVFADGHAEEVPVNGLDQPSAISVYDRGYIDIANFQGNSVLRASIKNWKESVFAGLKDVYCNTETTVSPLTSTICTKNFGSSSYSSPAEYVNGKWQFNPNGKTPGLYSIKYRFSSGVCIDSMVKDVMVFTTPILEPLEVLSDLMCGNYGIVARVKTGYGSPLDTIIWKNSTGAIVKVAAGSEDTLFLHTLPAGSYTALAKNPACSYQSPDNPTTTFKGRRFTMPADMTVCRGDGFIMKPTSIGLPSGPNTYLWTPSELFVGGREQLFQTQIDSLKATTVFKLTVTQNGCQTTDSVLVTVKPKPDPLVTGTPIPYILCPGIDTLIGFENAPTTGITYSWSYISTEFTNYTNITATTPAVTVTPSLSVVIPAGRPFIYNNYKLIAKNEFGCTVENPITIGIFDTPKVNLGKDTTICKGTSVELYKPESTYTNYDWKADPTLSSLVISNPIATPTATTSYILKVTNAAKCINYDTINVILKELPAKATMDRIVGMCDGDPAILGPKNPSSNYKYEWSPSAGLDNYLSPNPKATPSVSGTIYILTMKDISGTPLCSDTAKVMVKISSKPTNIVPSTTAGLGICPGQIAGLSVTSTAGYKIAWSPAETLNDSTLWTPIAKPVVTTTYKVKVTTADGCSDTSSVKVIVDKITADAGSDVTFCPDESGRFNGTATSGSAITSKKWSSDISGATSAPGVSDMQDLTSSVKIAAGTSKKYYLIVTNANSCSVADSVIVTAYEKPKADAGEDTGDCLGKSFMLGGVDNPDLPSTYSFKWAPGDYTESRPSVTPTSAGINEFILTVTDNVTKCTAKDTMELTVRPKPQQETIASSASQACVGTPVTLSVSRPVSWKDDNNNAIDDLVTAIQVDKDGKYWAIIEENGCYDSSFFDIDFMAPPAISAIEAPDKSCLADGIPLKVITTQADGIMQYEWTVASATGEFSNVNGDSTYFKADNSSLGTGPKTFTVNVHNQCGNVTLTKDVTFVPSPEASFKAESPSKSLDNTSKETLDAISGDAISFVNTVDTVAQNISTWEWNFKDGNTSDLYSTTYTFSNPGKYIVELKVINKDGCPAVAKLGVEVLSSKYLFVPNIFNPYSNNPENSVCKVYGLNISSQSFTFKVFNKWGEMVYQTSDFNMANKKGWDGTNAPMGVYTYMVVGKFNDGSEFEKSGTVTLVR